MRFDIVLVPFPFDDLSGQKVRPAVCLTDPLGPHRHIVIGFITSAVTASLESTDLLLDIGTPESAQMGLRVRSLLRLHRMATVSASIIVRRLGSLSPSLQTQDKQKLRSLFAL